MNPFQSNGSALLLTDDLTVIERWGSLCKHIN